VVASAYFCHIVCPAICRTDPDNIYQLFAEVIKITAGEYSIRQQYPTDNIDNVSSS